MSYTFNGQMSNYSSTNVQSLSTAATGNGTGPITPNQGDTLAVALFVSGAAIPSFAISDTASNTYLYAQGAVSVVASQTTALTFSAAPASGATSENLSANFSGTSGQYVLLFPDGELRWATLTNGSNACSWAGTYPTWNPTGTNGALTATQSSTSVTAIAGNINVLLGLYAQNVVNASTTTTVTTSYGNIYSLLIDDYGGLVTSGGILGAAGASFYNDSQPSGSNNIATASLGGTNTVLWGLAFDNNGNNSLTAGTGFTARTAYLSGPNGLPEDKAVSSAAAVAFTASSTYKYDTFYVIGIAFSNPPLSANVGTFSLSGQNVTFVLGNPVTGYTAIADTGVFNLFGATNTNNYELDVASVYGPGLFYLTGEAASFFSTSFFHCETGGFALNGQQLTFGDLLDSDCGVFSLSGPATSLSIGLATGVYDYYSLLAAISAYATSRLDINQYMQYFVQLAEERIYEELIAGKFGSGVQLMEQYYTTQISGGSCAVPLNFIGAKDFQVLDGNGSVFTLLYKDPQWMYANYPVQQPTGIPAYFARDGAAYAPGAQTFIFGPYPDSDYMIQGTYYGKSTPLSAANTMTWMTEYCPDVLLAACMLELQPFLKDPASAQIWQSIYDGKIGGLVNLDKAEGFAPGVLTMECE